MGHYSGEGRTVSDRLTSPLLMRPTETEVHHLSYEQVLLWLIKGSLFVIPFLVFYGTRDLFYLFAVGRVVLFRVLVEFSLVCWLGLVALRKRRLPSLRNPLLWVICGFLLITGIADGIGLNPYQSFWGNYERMEGYLSLVHFGALFLILTSVLEDKDWKIFWNLFLMAGVMTALYTLLAHFGLLVPFPADTSRPGSQLGNADLLSTYLLLTGGIGLLLCCTARSRSMRLLYGGAALLQLVTLYLPASRAVILALLGGAILFCLLYSCFGEHRSYRRMAAVFTIGLMALPLLYFAVRENRVVQADHLLSRFSSVTDPSIRSWASRLGLWAVLWKGFQERPLLGWGQEQVGQVMIKYVDPNSEFVSQFRDQYGYQVWFDRAHNVIAEWLISAGIIGVLSYLSLFGCAWYLLWRFSRQKILRRSEAIILCVLLVSYFLQNLFYFDSMISYVIFFAVLAYIGSRESLGGNSPNRAGDTLSPLEYDGGMESLEENAGCQAAHNTIASFDTPATERRSGRVILGVSLLVNFILVTSVVNVRPYLQARALGVTLDAFKTSNLDLVMEHFDHTLSFHSVGDTETRAWILFLADQLYRDPRQPLAVKARILHYAVREYEKEVKAHPADLRAQLYLTALNDYTRELQLQQPAPDAVLRQ